MVSQRDLENVVKQVNSSYEYLVNRVNSLESKLAALEAIPHKEEKVKK